MLFQNFFMGFIFSESKFIHFYMDDEISVVIMMGVKGYSLVRND